MVFIELPLFGKYITLSDDELRAVQDVILDNPEAGDLTQGGGGLRKLRAARPPWQARRGAGNLLLAGFGLGMLSAAGLPQERTG